MTYCASQIMTILRCKEVVARLKLSKTTLYYKINPNSPHYDARFPKPIRLGPNAVGWYEHEIDQYMRECQRVAR